MPGPWSPLFPREAVVDVDSWEYWQMFLAIAAVVASLPCLGLIGLFMSVHCCCKHRPENYSANTKKRKTYVFLLFGLALLIISNLSISFSVWILHFAVTEAGMVLQLVGNYYFSNVIHNTTMAYYEAWEDIGHSARAIEKDLGFILPGIDKNSTVHAKIETIRNDSQKIMNENYHVQVFWINFARGLLLYFSWTFGLAAASVAIITAISKRNKLPRWGGILAALACIFMFFSCAVHLPLTILWDDSCKDLTNTTDFSGSVVSYLNHTSKEWEDSFCDLFDITKISLLQLREVLEQYPVSTPYGFILPACTPNITLQLIEETIKSWKIEEMAIAKSFDVPVPVYYALMRTDKLLVVLFEMKKMISGNVMQDLASHLVNDICAHFTAPSMLLWIGTAFTGIVSLLAATASFKASQIFTEDVSSRLEDFDVIAKGEHGLSVLDDASLTNWERCKGYQKTALIATLLQLLVACTHVGTMTWNTDDPSVTWPNLAVLLSSVALSFLGCIAIWKSLSLGIITFSILNLVLLGIYGLVMYSTSLLLQSCAEHDVAKCPTDFEQSDAVISLTSTFVDVVSVFVATASAIIYFIALRQDPRDQKYNYQPINANSFMPYYEDSATEEVTMTISK